MSSQRPAKRRHFCEQCNGGRTGTGNAAAWTHTAPAAVGEQPTSKTTRSSRKAAVSSCIHQKHGQDIAAVTEHKGLLVARPCREPAAESPGRTEYRSRTGPDGEMRAMEAELGAAISTRDIRWWGIALADTRQRWQKDWNDWWTQVLSNVPIGYRDYVTAARQTWEARLTAFSEATDSLSGTRDRVAKLHTAFGLWLAEWSQWWAEEETERALPGLALAVAEYELKEKEREEEETVQCLTGLGAMYKSEVAAAAQFEGGCSRAGV
eukprot:g48713.t1